MTRRLPLWVLACAAVVMLAGVAGAQPDAPRVVTFDEVNAVAQRMYCPECENIPLHKCFTVVCIQWKQEIADRLAAGVDQQTIIDDFVARFGDQVVGVPQDPFLRTMALVAPPLLLGLSVAVGLWAVLSRLPRRAAPAPAPAAPTDRDSRYLARLEEDLKQE
ncbi:MAG: cytochrome c-type biogenesis protein CcmH [Anaerolineae bacterium]|jgi:cytochrome c-type biogenesis protein CcmH/NrfF|nr:cytochrome c-type biogenesis protein CcmH [Anaerolineae bacterium]